MSKSPFDLLVTALTPRYGGGEARSMARIVFEDAFQTRDYQSRRFSKEEAVQLSTICDRLVQGEPLQYVLGEADFWGMKLRVTPAVLIPRQETEELVAWALQWLKKSGIPSPKVLDVGAGSGCIALAMSKNMPSANVVAMDLSAAALAIARENADKYQLPVQFLQADALNPSEWPEGPFDLIVSNPPYIPESEKEHMPGHVLEHEPAMALFTGEGGPMEFYRALAAMAMQRLIPGGALLVEINEFRAEETMAVFREAGLQQVEVRRDIAGADRMVGE